MQTVRQENGSVALDIIRHHCACKTCGKRRWKTVHGDQDGVDLQCRGCGRLAEVKSMHCGDRVRARPRPTIPGGSYSVRERQVQQGYSVDLYVVSWDMAGRFFVRAVSAEDQPDDLFEPRTIQSGPRAGYRLSAIRLGKLARPAFPVLAEGSFRRGRQAPHLAAKADRKHVPRSRPKLGHKSLTGLLATAPRNEYP